MLKATWSTGLSSTWASEDDRSYERDTTGRSSAHIDPCSPVSRSMVAYRGRQSRARRNCENWDSAVIEKNFAADSGFSYNDIKKILNESCDMFDTIAHRIAIQPTYAFTCKDDLYLMIQDFEDQLSTLATWDTGSWSTWRNKCLSLVFLATKFVDLI